eukprot:TRINITY_DN47533_c0_g1_i1.p1 TRINITY_DN47533_c0_g1~~TRINITY_DN47533_c0_g1_i1.p1  ORF type:complete len:583 (-),score=50.03 TRINITY_DN47533_c0_g1_i1:103-1797(-)
MVRGKCPIRKFIYRASLIYLFLHSFEVEATDYCVGTPQKGIICSKLDSTSFQTAVQKIGNDKVATLVLEKANIRDKDMGDVVKMVSQLSSLKTLNLKANFIGQQGAALIAEQLAAAGRAPTIEEVHLGGQQQDKFADDDTDIHMPAKAVEETSIEDIGRMVTNLAGLTSLKLLDIDGYMIGNAGVKLFVDTLLNRQGGHILETLILSNNDISAEGTEALARLALDVPDVLPEGWVSQLDVNGQTCWRDRTINNTECTTYTRPMEPLPPGWFQEVAMGKLDRYSQEKHFNTWQAERPDWEASLPVGWVLETIKGHDTYVENWTSGLSELYRRTNVSNNGRLLRRWKRPKTRPFAEQDLPGYGWSSNVMHIHVREGDRTLSFKWKVYSSRGRPGVVEARIQLQKPGFAEGTLNNVRLDTLDLSDNPIGDEGVVHLEELLSSLSTLKLDRSRIGHKGWSMLANTIETQQPHSKQPAKRLLNLHLAGNPSMLVDNSGSRVPLANAFTSSNMRMITTLDLKDNRLIAEDIHDLLKHFGASKSGKVFVTDNIWCKKLAVQSVFTPAIVSC